MAFGMCHMRYILVILTSVLISIVYGQQCNVVPKCTCAFDEETVDVAEQTSYRNEALAGTVGALGSLVVSGGGFGIWYLLKSRGGGLDSGLDRSDSALSDDTVERGKKGKGPPPAYNSRFTPQPKSPNIYKAGARDNLSHKVAPSFRRNLDMF
ncbi:hypothetical protein ACF0H5_003647 [Mactra antiquata]